MNYLLGAELNGNQLKIVALKKVGSTYEIVIIDKLNITGEGTDAVNQLIMWKDQKIPEATSVKVVLTVSESVLYIKEIEFPYTFISGETETEGTVRRDETDAANN